MKGFKFLLQPKDFEAIFVVSKFGYGPFLFFQATTDLNLPFFKLTPIFLKTLHIVSTRTLLSTELGMPAISRVFFQEYWAFFKQWLSVLTSPSTSLLLTVLTTAISASNLLKWVRVSLTSLDRSVICKPRVTSVFKSSYINSGMFSLFSTASVLIALIIISMLQCQINKMLLLTRQLDCKIYERRNTYGLVKG